LPGFASRLEALSKEVYTGLGLVVLRGLDPKAFTTEENITIFAGISSYIGEKRGSQANLFGKRSMLSMDDIDHML
jgi:hypothetical protein